MSDDQARIIDILTAMGCEIERREGAGALESATGLPLIRLIGDAKWSDLCIRMNKYCVSRHWHSKRRASGASGWPGWRLGEVRLKGGKIMSASNWVHLDVELIVRETESAFLLRLEDGQDYWVPKSQVADAQQYNQGDEGVTVSVTEWVAREKGLTS